MPFTINGIGTSICSARGDVSWGSQDDCDAVECLVVLFLPVIPYRTIHTYAWNGTQYRYVPIRWSTGLIIRAFLRRWLYIPLLITAIIGLAESDRWAQRDAQSKVTTGAGILTIAAITPLGLWLLWRTDRRTRSIRRVLGPHELGSSDPATWKSDLLANISDPKATFGTSTFAEAVMPQLTANSPSRAMWAARLSTVLEDRVEGERLTDEILHQPGMDEAIEKVRRNSTLWSAVMAGS